MGQIKLDKEDVKLIKELLSLNKLYDREIAQMFGVSRKHINAIKLKQRWNYDYGQETETSIKEAIVGEFEKRRVGIYGFDKGAM
jgi:endonuclease YncB( thermonuclease family)